MKRLGVVVSFLYAVATVLVSVRYIAPRLFLLCKMGGARVHREHIHILAMPKNGPWPLSIGEAITDGFFVEYLIGLACWFAMFWGGVGLVVLISRVVRRRHRP